MMRKFLTLVWTGPRAGSRREMAAPIAAEAMGADGVWHSTDSGYNPDGEYEARVTFAFETGCGAARRVSDALKAAHLKPNVTVSWPLDSCRHYYKVPQPQTVAL